MIWIKDLSINYSKYKDKSQVKSGERIQKSKKVGMVARKGQCRGRGGAALSSPG